ncbi:MAG: UbiA prenyltransferase family protein [Oscillospiraceae bacterium]|nr:UbiA prenyltransferase family protein [Oscillospiraceae bacterium]
MNYIKVIRPKAWLKNVFVFVPIVFAIQLFNLDKLLTTLAAFGAFCMISSAVYLFNDICDAKKDALHPVKKSRPIASGKIKRSVASAYAIALAGVGIAVSLLVVNRTMTAIALGYLCLNLAYTILLKNVAVLDCFCIAAGFVLRVYAGGAASGSAVSDWLFLTVTAASLFMAFGKRRGEILKLRSPTADASVHCAGQAEPDSLPKLRSPAAESSSQTRTVLQQYNIDFLKGMVFICAGLAVVFYSLWAMEKSNMIYTVPLMIFMVAKYLLNIHKADSHGDPTTVVFSDVTFLLSGALYAAVTVVLLYGGKVII